MKLRGLGGLGVTSAVLVISALLVINAMLLTNAVPGAAAAERPQGIRSAESIADSTQAPALPARQQGQLVPRVWERQPPVIPHDTRGQQIDRRHNRCLDCHQGAGPSLTGATAISATHYVNRDGEALQRLAGARYFCLSCHVPQQSVPLLTGSRVSQPPASLEENEQ
jgi:nitrate reductase (cytochrome), electron transfer subunit